MRTTFDIDPQVLLVLKETAKRERISLGEVVNRLVREHRSTYEVKERNGIPLLPNRIPGSVVTPEHVRELMDEYED